MKQPGSLVREFASRRKWPIATCNLVVEGELDRDYFHLANDLYKISSGKSLFCSNFRVFPIGEGEEGGTEGVLRDFPVLRRLIEIDLNEKSQRVFTSAVLLDDDASGRGAKNDLCSTKYNFEFCKDVFLVQRSYSLTQNPSAIRSQYETIKRFRGREDIFCEIEDLVNENLILEFARINHNVFKQQPKVVGSEAHYFFRRDVKRALFKFVKANAILCDVSCVLQTIKFFRNFFLGDSEGVQID